MAPISQLHGLGVEEFSQTGPVDHITAIVNRTKTNVVSNSIVRSFFCDCPLGLEKFQIWQNKKQIENSPPGPAKLRFRNSLFQSE